MGIPECPYDTQYPPDKIPLYHLKRQVELRIEDIVGQDIATRFSSNLSAMTGEVAQLKWVLAEIDKILGKAR